MKHILYTEEEGGKFYYISKTTSEETVAFFNKIIEDKRFEIFIGDEVVNIVPAYIALVETISDYDFLLERTRIL